MDADTPAEGARAMRENAGKKIYFQTRSLSVGYRGNALIRDIDLDIEKGEIVTLIGPNGSGKSTILRSITRQLQLISGRVCIAEKELKSLSFRELSTRQAVVLTERLRPELMSCHDVVATGRYPYTGRLGILTPEDEKKVEEAMRAVHAEEIGSRDFNAVSDGQKQRVMLARALCQEPEMIVLDEPTSFLDIRYKLELLSVLRRLAKEKGITVVMSLHELDLAMKISDRVVCVSGETIYAVGAPEELLTDEGLRRLYRLEQGSFDILLGSAELPAPEGEPEVFVLSAGGSGIPVYRALQREGRAFIAGILYPNDLDYRVAKRLAGGIIEEKAFCRISDRSYARGLAAVQGCREVIDAGFPLGEINARMEELRREAERLGKLRKR